MESPKTICAVGTVSKPKKCPNCRTMNMPTATVCKKCKAELPAAQERDSEYDPYA